jgi:hypothetical protein
MMGQRLVQKSDLSRHTKRSQGSETCTHTFRCVHSEPYEVRAEQATDLTAQQTPKTSAGHGDEKGAVAPLTTATGLSPAHTAKGRLQRALLDLLRVHEREGTLPTSALFLFYELGQLRPAITPPSTLRMAPVIQLASSESRKVMA